MPEKRGRKTSLDLPALALIPGGGRPEPPEGMPDDEAETWRTVVDSMPAGWFVGPSGFLLRQFCRCVAASNVVAQETRAVTAQRPIDLIALNRLSSANFRVTMAMLSAAAKLRMTPQARVRQSAAEAAVRNMAK